MHIRNAMRRWPRPARQVCTKEVMEQRLEAYTNQLQLRVWVRDHDSMRHCTPWPERTGPGICHQRSVVRYVGTLVGLRWASVPYSTITYSFVSTESMFSICGMDLYWCIVKVSPNPRSQADV
jgi:hypothetical protein